MRTVSNSEVQTFKDCRRRWYLQYVRCLRPKQGETTSSAAHLGTVVHKALFHYYEDGANPEEVVAQTYNELDTLEDVEKQRKLALAMASGYQEWVETEGIDAGRTVLANELPFTIKLNEKFTVRGKIDQLYLNEASGSVHVRDFKTVLNFTEPLKYLPLDEQMPTYLSMFVDDETPITDDKKDSLVGKVPVAATYTMIRKVQRSARAKPPFYYESTITYPKQHRQLFKQRLEGVLWDMDTQLSRGEELTLTTAYPRPSKDCSWKCPYMEVCKFANEDSKVAETLLHNEFEQYDPNERYANDTSN